MSEQKKAEEFGITEDDVSEIRQDINKFRFELVEILRKNRFDVGKVGKGDNYCGGRRAKQMERRIMKGFNLDIHDLVKDAFDKQDKSKTVDIFQVMAEAMNKNKSSQFQSEFSRLNLDNDEANQYSPATMAAAKKFKRFLGKRLKPEPTFGEKLLPNAPSINKENDNHIDFKYQSLTAPNSPYLNRGILSESSPKKESTEQLKKQMMSAAMIPCTITLKVPGGDQGSTITTSSREAKGHSSEIRNSISYIKDMTGNKSKEENGGVLDQFNKSNNKYSFQELANNIEENGKDGRIQKYTNYSSPSNQQADQSRKTMSSVSSPGKDVNQGETDLTHHNSHSEKNFPEDKDCKALSPIHRLLERNAIRNAAGALTTPDKTLPNTSCSKLTSVRRPNQVTSGWI